VLLDPTLENPQPEKLGIPNVGSLRGFQVIDAAKHALEEACPGTVSCADIVAFAARDASYILSVSDYRIDFNMPAGRLDGRYSNATETLDFLPSPFGNLSEPVTKFTAKGLDEEDLVVLSGANSIGRATAPPLRIASAVGPTWTRRSRGGSGEGARSTQATPTARRSGRTR